MNKRRYGLFTAITMITGIVIGSGIFFKADNVLSYTNGNVQLGIIVFCIAAIAIIFGCLAISQLANRTDKPGGLIAYTEEFVGIGPSCAFGWFQEDLKSGKKDHEDFWIQMKDKYVLIRYFAVRNREGKYLGILEFTQDIQPIQDIKDEKRLVSEE